MYFAQSINNPANIKSIAKANLRIYPILQVTVTSISKALLTSCTVLPHYESNENVAVPHPGSAADQ